MAKKPRPAKPRVIVTRRLPPNVEARMAELFDASFNVGDQPMSRTELARAMAQCDVLVPCISDQIDATLIAAAPDRLQLLASFGSGVDHINLAAARAKGIIVTNTPGVLTEDTADMTMALILSVPAAWPKGRSWCAVASGAAGARRGCSATASAARSSASSAWAASSRAVARRARAFGLTIAYHNRHRLPFEVEQELEAEWVGDVDGLLAACDIVSIHCPLNGDTRGLIDARRIALMRPDAYLINTSRAEITDEAALIAALDEGRIAGAGLDVYTHEPAVDPRLFALSNVVLLPHVGSATFEGRDATGARVIANIRSWVDGHRPPNQVLEGWV